MGTDVYDPARWSNFFLLVGTGSAALTGLVFVAISVNLKAVAADATHTYRAINMLSGFTAAFVLGCLALMGHQTGRTLGLEWLLVSLLAAAVNTNGYVRGFRSSGSRYALGFGRIVGGSACYLGQVVGSLMMILGSAAGIYVSATSLVVNFLFLVSGSWLLIVGTLHGSDEAPV